MTAALDELLAAGVAVGTFPAAQASVWLEGARAFQGAAGEAQVDTLFDLASLTKALCTTACFIGLWAEGRLEPSTPVARAFPGTPLADAGVTAAELLAHRSGLPAYVPFFAEVMRATPQLLQLGCPPDLRRTTRLRLREVVLRTPLAAAPRSQSVYSDPGFIVLGELLAECGAEPLDALQARFVTRRFGLPLHFHKLSARGRDMRDPCAGDWDRLPPTGSERPRPPASGQSRDWRTVPPVPSAPGEVDDDNAWVLDGVAGHAGLFGTADDVARFGQRVLEELDGAGRLAPPSHWAWAVTRDASVQGSTRAFGFDTPSVTDSSAGRLLGAKPPGAFGHLGFTGTSLWVDRARRLSVALLTNRTHGGRDNLRIQEFRPRFHDAVVESLGLA